jgi:hypothetical protein
MALTRVAILAILAAGCAPAFGVDYGDPSLRIRPYPALDSALAGHQGKQVSVWAQPDELDPLLPPPAMVSFRGALGVRQDGWLHLHLRNGDTTRVGLDYVRRVSLVRNTAPRNRVAAALAGAVGFGLAGWVYTRSNSRSSSAEDFAVVGGGALLGAGVGVLLIPGSRLGAQIYPVVTPRPRITTP